MSGSQSFRVDEWIGILEGLKGLPNKVNAQKSWDNSAYETALAAAIGNFEADVEALEASKGFVFTSSDDREDLTRKTIDMLRRWTFDGQSPSLAALVAFAVHNMKLDVARDYQCIAMMGAVLGEVENSLPYHNNMHYRKVLLQLIRLIVVHNEIYEGTPRAFDARQIILMMTAACIHDYEHDGQGNTVRGVYEQSRLERYSFLCARPYLEAAGLREEEDIVALRVMLLGTDVTPLGEPVSAMAQVKAAYRYHFLGGKERTEKLNLDVDLKPLEQDRSLALMTLILHEADIATSAGLSYDVTKYETATLCEELEMEVARPSHVVDFLENICQRQFLSHAGQELYSANIARTYALAEQDVKAGDNPLETADKADFSSKTLDVVSADEAGDVGDSKTIN